MMQAIIDFINSFWDSLFSSFEKIVFWVGDMIGSLISGLMDGCFAFVIGFVQLLSLPAAAFSSAAQWASLPPQLIYLINAFGIPQGLALLGSAYLIRLTLNLIPASLTRV